MFEKNNEFIVKKVIKVEKTQKENIWYDIENYDENSFEPNFLVNNVVAHNSGGVDEYLENRSNVKHAKEKLDKVHPKLWPILQESFGIPVFQEQIMFILQDIGNFSLAEADKGRKILKLLHKGNQEKTDAFFKMLDKFKKNAQENGVQENELNWLLDVMGKYSEYSFNKSHALSYSINAYIAMYLKVHYEKEYYATLLNYSGKDEISWYIKQAKVQNIQFNDFKLKNTSDKFEVDYENNSIRMGLNIVKGVQSTDIEKVNSIQANNLEELVQQIAEKKISKRSFEPLCRLNYFRDIFKNSKLLETVINECRRIKKSETYASKINKTIEEKEDVQNYTKKEYQQFEKQYLQFYISGHPFDDAAEKVKKYDKEMFQFGKTPKQIADEGEEGLYIVYGIINDIEIRTSKKSGRKYYKLLLEDDEKQIYITVFNDVEVGPLRSGNLVLMPVSKNNFGFTKTRDFEIQKID